MNALHRIIVLGALACLGSLSPAHSQVAAIQDIVGGQPATSVANATYGWRFSLDASVSVTHLGLLDAIDSGFLEEHRVGIWNGSDDLVAEITFPAGESGVLENGFRYLPVASPVTLQAGQNYSIGSWNLSTSDNAVISAHFTTQYAPEINYLGAGYSQLTGFAAPKNDISLAHGYFGPTLKFELVPVPEPREHIVATAILLLASLAVRRTFALVTSGKEARS
jgi:hypothetical protein